MRMPMPDAAVRLWQAEDGATTVEYGLLVAAITLAVVALTAALGGQIFDTLGGLASSHGGVEVIRP